MHITLGQQYNVGEKPTVILCIYINRHAGTPKKHFTQTRDNVVHHKKKVVVIYITYRAASKKRVSKKIRLKLLKN